jgi:hypothetical protein
MGQSAWEELVSQGEVSTASSRWLLEHLHQGVWGATEQKVHLSPIGVCIPEIAISVRVDNVLLIDKILWE